LKKKKKEKKKKQKKKIEPDSKTYEVRIPICVTCQTPILLEDVELFLNDAELVGEMKKLLEWNPRSQENEFVETKKKSKKKKKRNPRKNTRIVTVTARVTLEVKVKVEVEVKVEREVKATVIVIVAQDLVTVRAVRILSFIVSIMRKIVTEK